MVRRPILHQTRPLVALALYAIALGISACDGREASPSPSPSASTTASASTETVFVLTSSALSAGSWPSADTCDGSDGVPDLHWTAGPPGTRSYALQLFDVVSGRNDFGREGYAGPCPPKGSQHRYVFTVYAVDRSLELQPLYSHAEFQKALENHVLGQATLTATYAR